MLTGRREADRGHIDVERQGRRTVGADALPSPRDRAATPEDLRLALRAATLYYLDGLTQAEIASGSGSPGRRPVG